MVGGSLGRLEAGYAEVRQGGPGEPVRGDQRFCLQSFRSVPVPNRKS